MSKDVEINLLFCSRSDYTELPSYPAAVLRSMTFAFNMSKATSESSETTTTKTTEKQLKNDNELLKLVLSFWGWLSSG